MEPDFVHGGGRIEALGDRVVIDSVFHRVGDEDTCVVHLPEREDVRLAADVGSGLGRNRHGPEAVLGAVAVDVGQGVALELRKVHFGPVPVAIGQVETGDDEGFRVGEYRIHIVQLYPAGAGDCRDIEEGEGVGRRPDDGVLVRVVHGHQITVPDLKNVIARVGHRTQFGDHSAAGEEGCVGPEVRVVGEVLHEGNPHDVAREQALERHLRDGQYWIRILTGSPLVLVAVDHPRIDHVAGRKGPVGSQKTPDVGSGVARSGIHPAADDIGGGAFHLDLLRDRRAGEGRRPVDVDHRRDI